MRTQRARYGAAAATSGSVVYGTALAALTGDFSGGWVQINATITVNATNGGWNQIVATVDGAGSGPTVSNYQSGNFLTQVVAVTLRVPPGRRRISVICTGNSGAVTASGGYLDVVEAA